MSWNAQQLNGDLAPAVRALKERISGDLVSYGCGEFAGQLVANGLVDELRFWINPRSWGPGARPFPDIVAAHLLGRRVAAIELEPRFCDVIVRRWLALDRAHRASRIRAGRSEEVARDA